MSISKPTYATSQASAVAAGVKTGRPSPPPNNNYSPVWIIPQSVQNKLNVQRYRFEVLREPAPGGSISAQDPTTIEFNAPLSLLERIRKALGKSVTSRDVQSLPDTIPVFFRDAINGNLWVRYAQLNISGSQFTYEDVRRSSMSRLSEIEAEQNAIFNDLLREVAEAEEEKNNEIESDIEEIIPDSQSLEAVNTSSESAEMVVEANLESMSVRSSVIDGDELNTVVVVPEVIQEPGRPPSVTVDANEIDLTGIGERDSYKPRMIIEIQRRGQSASSSQVYEFKDFILLSANEIDAEKFQVVETFGQPKVYFFDRRARIYTYSIALRNDAINKWYDKWRKLYDEHIRGTQLVKNSAKVILQYDGVTRVGYILQSSNNQDGNMDKMGNVSFTMFVESERNRDVEIDITYEGVSEEEIRELEGEITVSNCAVRAARVNAILVLSSSPTADVDPVIQPFNISDGSDRRSSRFYVRSIPSDDSVDECSTDAAKKLISRFTIDVELEESEDDIVTQNQDELLSLVRELRLVPSGGGSEVSHGGSTGRIAENDEGTPYQIRLPSTTRIPSRIAFLLKEDQVLRVPFSITFNGSPRSIGDPPSITGEVHMIGASKTIDIVNSPISLSGGLNQRINRSNSESGYTMSIDIDQGTALSDVDNTDPVGSVVGRVRFQVRSGGQAVSIDENDLPSNNRLPLSNIEFPEGPSDIALVESNKESLKRSFVRFRKVEGSNTDIWAEFVIVGNILGTGSAISWSTQANSAKLSAPSQSNLTINGIPIEFVSSVKITPKESTKIQRVEVDPVFTHKEPRTSFELTSKIFIDMVDGSPVTQKTASMMVIEIDPIIPASGRPSGNPRRVKMGDSLVINMPLELTTSINSGDTVRGYSTLRQTRSGPVEVTLRFTPSFSLSASNSSGLFEEIVVDVLASLPQRQPSGFSLNQVSGLSFLVKVGYPGEEFVTSRENLGRSIT